LGTQQKNFDFLMKGGPGASVYRSNIDTVVSYGMDMSAFADKKANINNMLTSYFGETPKNDVASREGLTTLLDENIKALERLEQPIDMPIFDGEKWINSRGKYTRTELLNMFNIDAVQKGSIAKGQTSGLDMYISMYENYSGLQYGVSPRNPGLRSKYIEGLQNNKIAPVTEIFFGHDKELGPAYFDKLPEYEQLLRERVTEGLEDLSTVAYTSNLLVNNKLVGNKASSLYSTRAPVVGMQAVFNESLFEHGGIIMGDAITGSRLPAGTSRMDLARLMTETYGDKAAKTAARVGIETHSRTVSRMLNSFTSSKWGKRAAVAALALMVLDPNTNSILLPDQRGDGERYDIPTVNELFSSRKNRIVKTKGSSPALVDKFIKEAGLSTAYGFPGYNNGHIPPAPAGSNSYHASKRRKDPLSLQQIARQVGGIVLR